MTIIESIKNFFNNRSMMTRILENMDFSIDSELSDDDVPSDFDYDKSVHNFSLTKKEAYLAHNFCKEHLSCARKNPATIGGYVNYSFTPTGIGDCVKIKCNICGEEKDITDYDTW